MRITVTEIAYHRNGIGGNGFHVVLFKDEDGPEPMVGVVFEEKGSVAVFDAAKLGAGEIDSMLNAWRGDVYEPALREAVAQHDRRVCTHRNAGYLDGICGLPAVKVLDDEGACRLHQTALEIAKGAK